MRIQCIAGFLLVVSGCSSDAETPASTAEDTQLTKVVSQKDAATEVANWGTFYTYFSGPSFGVDEGLSGVAVIKPGMEIHPPHKHADEEYLLVLEGAGTWSVNGEIFAAKAGDMLYAAPWDVHGITNTGKGDLKFVVFKWTARGLPVAPEPLEK